MNFDQYLNTNDNTFEVTLIPSIFDRSIKCINATSALEQTAEILNTYNYNLYQQKLDY